jgi:arsenate reductase (thioredoxin)
MQYSKNIKDFKDTNIDLVVSVCRSSAKIACAICSSPTVMGKPELISATLPRAKHYLQHGFSDPSEAQGTEEERLSVFRRTRDEIKKWITEEFANLTVFNWECLLGSQ